MARNLLDNPGRIIMARQNAPMDALSARDIATAFHSASEKLDSSSSGVNGKAIYVTKCKTNKPTTTPDIMRKYAEELDWKVTELPAFVFSAMKTGYRTIQTAKSIFTTPNDEDIPGFPFDLIMEASDQEMTFDNSLAHRLLDYKPDETWEDAVVSIAKEFRVVHPHFFQK